MRILIFTSYFYPNEGGLENYILEVAKGLGKRKNEVDVVTFNLNNYPSIEKHKEFVVYRLPGRKILGGVYVLPKFNREYRRIMNILAHKRYDLINTQTRFFITTIMGMRFAKKRSIPFVHTEHGNSFVKHPSQITRLLSWIYDQTIGRKIFSSADRVICISEAGVRFAIKMGASKQRILCIPNSVNLKAIKPKIMDKEKYKEELGIGKKELVMTFVGRLIYAKGVQDLLQALNSLNSSSQNKKMDFKLLIIGDGPYKAELKRMAHKLNIPTIFMNTVPHDEITKVYSITDILINPSHSEGLPTTVLEAGAMKIPVIASDVGGTREIISNENYGRLFPARNIKQLTSIIQSLCSDKELRRKLGLILYNKVKKEYNLESNLKILERELNVLISAKYKK
ncbi:MAG: glycosyltransferase family 4 protein [Candidatus Woesearchaeota archaeon]|jgi:glycosyltransferase involved in cell wall biosynthesis